MAERDGVWDHGVLWDHAGASRDRDGMPARVRIAPFPDSSGLNPYYDLFYGALERHGVELVMDARFEVPWFTANRQRVDWIHFHWVHYFYDNASGLLTIQGAARLLAMLVRIRRLGIHLAWTCHNLFPHESRSRAVDYAVRLGLARLSDVVIVHSAAARRQVATHFGRVRNVLSVPHGHYIDVYPGEISREEARSRLDLPSDAFVYLCFGALRAYKGVEDLMRAFQDLADPEAVLLIVGPPIPVEYGRVIQMAAEGEPRIRCVPRAVPSSDVPTYFKAANLAVFPFRRVLSSGSLLLALSLGVPVLVPDVASLREYLGADVAHVVERGEAWTRALRVAKARVLHGELLSGADTVEWARRFAWDDAARRVAPALTGPLGSTSGLNTVRRSP